MTLNNINTADEGPSDPLKLFGQWLSEAEQIKISYPNAMCVSTTTPNGTPSARTILLKEYDSAGFVFYTNQKKQKVKGSRKNSSCSFKFFLA